MHYCRSFAPDSEPLRTYVEMTHELWGGSQSVEARVTTFNRRLQYADAALTCLSGLLSPSGQLVAGLKRYCLSLRVGRSVHSCIGLGGIFTEPSARRRGHAETLIRATLAQAVEEGCAFAVLFSDIGLEYYARFGFRALAANYWSCEVSALPSVVPFDFRVARADEIQGLVAGYSRAVSAAPCSIERTLLTWQFFHDFNGVEQDLILSDGDGRVGQVSITRCKSRGYLWIEEWFLTAQAQTTPGMVERVWATLGLLAAQDGVPLIRGWVLPLHTLPNAARRDVRAKQIPMIAALTLAQALDPEILAGAYIGAADHF